MDLHRLLGPYAIGAVDDDERLAFERHLATCDACWREVPSLVTTAARVAAVRPRAPR